MFTLTRILSLAAAGALLALTAVSIPASAYESAPNLGPVVPHDPILAECHLLKRAIARRACQARLRREEYIDTAPEQATDSQRKEAFPAEADGGGVGVGGSMSPSTVSR
jgi:hypothetical protein